MDTRIQSRVHRSSLTPRRERFVEEYLIDLNATQAAIRAGYSAKTAKMQGSRLMTYDDVSAAITEARAKLSARTGLTVAWVLERLRENAERAAQAVPVLDREGKPTGQYTYQGSVVNAALELLGKHLGMFNRTEADTNDRPIQLIVYLDGKPVQPLAPRRIGAGGLRTSLTAGLVGTRSLG